MSGVRVQIIVEGNTRFDGRVVSSHLINHLPEKWADPERMCLTAKFEHVEDGI